MINLSKNAPIPVKTISAAIAVKISPVIFIIICNPLCPSHRPIGTAETEISTPKNGDKIKNAFVKISKNRVMGIHSQNH